MKRVALVMASLALGAATGATAAVFRCTAADGGVTYQDAACAGVGDGATDIPTNFPPPNEAERARILQREADLERRLEARRERESREAALRIASAPAPAPAPAAEPMDGYPLYFPLGGARIYPRHPANRPPHARPAGSALRP